MNKQNAASCAGSLISTSETAPDKQQVVLNHKQQEKNMIQAGTKAPDFEASIFYQGDFKKVKLSDYLGKWVVLCFYPGDFTFVCATEISAIAEKYSDFQKLNTQVLSVSTDSIFVHKMWVEQELSKMTSSKTIPFPMLSDGGGKIGKIYGVYDEEDGVDIRGRFLIDPEGIIVGYEILTPPVGRNVFETLRQIEAYQNVQAGKGIAPAGWKPGKAFLQPGPALVGKVWENWKVEQAFN